eukprot:280070-Rhodomonas_salina.1
MPRYVSLTDTSGSNFHITRTTFCYATYLTLSFVVKRRLVPVCPQRVTGLDGAWGTSWEWWCSVRPRGDEAGWNR